MKRILFSLLLIAFVDAKRCFGNDSCSKTSNNLGFCNNEGLCECPDPFKWEDANMYVGNTCVCKSGYFQMTSDGPKCIDNNECFQDWQCKQGYVCVGGTSRTPGTCRLRESAPASPLPATPLPETAAAPTDVTTLPVDITTSAPDIPAATTSAPAGTTSAPDATIAPVSTTSPDTTTSAPDATTAPVSTTSPPDTTAPAGTTSAPDTPPMQRVCNNETYVNTSSLVDDNGLVIGQGMGEGTLFRGKNYLLFQGSADNLTSNSFISIWFGLISHPENCLNAPCDGQDILNIDVSPFWYWGGYTYSDKNGHAQLLALLNLENARFYIGGQLDKPYRFTEDNVIIYIFDQGVYTDSQTLFDQMTYVNDQCFGAITNDSRNTVPCRKIAFFNFC